MVRSIKVRSTAPFKTLMSSVLPVPPQPHHLHLVQTVPLAARWLTTAVTSFLIAFLLELKKIELKEMNNEN